MFCDSTRIIFQPFWKIWATIRLLFSLLSLSLCNFSEYCMWVSPTILFQTVLAYPLNFISLDILVNLQFQGLHQVQILPNLLVQNLYRILPRLQLILFHIHIFFILKKNHFFIYLQGKERNYPHAVSLPKCCRELTLGPVGTWSLGHTPGLSHGGEDPTLKPSLCLAGACQLNPGIQRWPGLEPGHFNLEGQAAPRPTLINIFQIDF